MKKIILALLLVAVGTTATADDAVLSYAVNIGAALKFSCSVMRRDCSDLGEPPAIIWSYSPFLYGQYDGEGHIMLSADILNLDPVMASGIIVHEMTHFVDDKFGVASEPYTKESLCATEANAWRVYNAWVSAAGRLDLLKTDWFLHYHCFVPDEEPTGD